MPKKQKETKVSQPAQKVLLKKKQVNKTENIIIHRLDASGKILGRLSTEAANLLRGKNKVDFVPYKLMGDKVIIFNGNKFKVTGNKMTDKIYYHHTGYIGHLKSESMADLFRKDPSEIIRRSIYGMLPKNKLQDKWMKNLTIYNGEENARKDKNN